MKKLYSKIVNIYRYRQLLWHLSIRELKIKYKYPFLGFLWMLLIPLSMAVIFTIVFSIIVKIPVPGYPFFIFLMTGVFPWSYINSALASTTTSIVDNSDLIKKIYFPREIIPLSILISNLISFLIMMAVVIIFLLVFKVSISEYIIFLPFIVILHTLFTIGIILITSSLQVFYRDVKYIIEIILIFWFYLNPVFYPLSLVADVSPQFLSVYMLNPLACLITFYRIVLLDNFATNIPSQLNLPILLFYTIFVSIAIFLLGMYLFNKNDKRLSDFL